MRETLRVGRTAFVLPCLWLAAAACSARAQGGEVNSATPSRVDEASVSSATHPESTSGAPATMQPGAGAAGSQGAGGGAAAQEPPVMVPMRATAELTAAKGNPIEGEAKFFQQPEGVLVVIEVRGAPPGRKGIHVHTRGDCSDPAGQSMGPHFAPKLEQHALPSEPAPRHLGDLGNISVGADGKGRLELRVPAATLGADDSTSFLGRALIVHAAEDVGSGAQPAGDSGAPIACGVIHEQGS